MSWGALVDLHFKRITRAAVLRTECKDTQEEVDAIAVIHGWTRVIAAKEVRGTRIPDIF